MKENIKPADKPKKYKTTEKAQELIVDQLRPYDLWTSGRCPVCGYGYSARRFSSGQLRKLRAAP